MTTMNMSSPDELVIGLVSISDRAARLRAEGVAALGRHLAAQTGEMHRILTEGPRIGRTEQFTEVAFGSDQPEGTILTRPIRANDGRRLLA